MTAEPGRVLALDIGSKRIGVALSDTTRLLASPLTTVRAEPRAAAYEQIAGLVDRHAVTQVVVGLPLTLSGEIGPQAQSVRAFVAELRKRVAVPVDEFDERLTSAEAERMMLDAGIKPAQRRMKIDEIAASIILRDYLEASRNREGTL